MDGVVTAAPTGKADATQAHGNDDKDSKSNAPGNAVQRWIDQAALAPIPLARLTLDTHNDRTRLQRKKDESVVGL